MGIIMISCEYCVVNDFMLQVTPVLDWLYLLLIKTIEMPLYLILNKPF